jgi:hypothetical protein
MSDLTKRLCRPGYDLQKEQAIQEAIIEIRELRAKDRGDGEAGALRLRGELPGVISR